eukprot:8615153-Pyramimonas_sp.AAC.1
MFAHLPSRPSPVPPHIFRLRMVWSQVWSRIEPCAACRYCRDIADKAGRERLFARPEAYQAVVQYCRNELPEAWDAIRNVVVLCMHLLVRLLTEDASTDGQSKGDYRVVGLSDSW